MYNQIIEVAKKVSPLKILLPLLGILLLVSCIYTVDQTEYAVVTTFGKPNEHPISSGLKFKMPYPIQSVKKLSKETFSTAFGYSVKVTGEEVFNEEETKMITGDENIIMVDLEVQWKIADPVAYLYNTSNPRSILLNATSSALRSVVGSSMVDDVLTDGRTKITSDIRENLTNAVNEYNLGISIVNVNLQDVDLPTAEVDQAFKAVTDAREERITTINLAQKYRNERENEVMGERDALLSKAEATKVAIVEKAKGDTAKFEAIFSEYEKNKGITRQRLIIETLEQTLKDAKLYITDGSDGILKHLPLEAFKGGN